MTDLDVSLPAHGEAPWDGKLNTAILAIQGRVNALGDSVDGGSGGDGGPVGPVGADDITDASAIGKTILRAADAAAVRSATLAASAADLDNVFGIATAAAPSSRLVNGHPLSADVVITEADIAGLAADLAALAPKASPALTGTPASTTPGAGDRSTRIATTAYVKGELDGLINGAPGTLDTLKEIADQLSADESAVSALTTTVASKVSSIRTINGHALSADVTLALADIAGAAALASPTFTGDPKAPTPATSDNDTSIATTAFVQAVVAALSISSYATLASPTFTGDPKAPTPAAGDNDTSIATTAFVHGEVAAFSPNFTKMVSITQSAYDALVTAGTVVSTTLYVIS